MKQFVTKSLGHSQIEFYYHAVLDHNPLWGQIGLMSIYLIEALNREGQAMTGIFAPLTAIWCAPPITTTTTAAPIGMEAE